jgi:signal transduction histidine kinase
MIGGGMFLYFAVRKDVYRQIDTSLVTEKDIIQDQVEQTDTIPDFSVTFGHQIEVRFLNGPVKESGSIRDTVINDDRSGEELHFRYIIYKGNTLRKRGYMIFILKEVTEKIDLLEAISLYTFFLFLSLLVISLFLNYMISRQLWKPFYRSVSQAEAFTVLSDSPMDLPETDILEFRQLNNVIQRMTMKMRRDYLNLKEYNENAAHEIQTPLAIIRSKTELLMQSGTRNKENLGHLKAINEATSRLLKLNQGLLLISKIDNQYYHEVKRLSLAALLEQSLDNYREIMQLKKIRVDFNASSDAVVVMNDVLADVLITNLLSNAVRYNTDGGFIRCFIDDSTLVLSNSGQPLVTNPELLFKRFYKGSDHPQSVGLGLSIVRKITELYGMMISYACKDSEHIFTLHYRNRS